MVNTRVEARFEAIEKVVWEEAQRDQERSATREATVSAQFARINMNIAELLRSSGSLWMGREGRNHGGKRSGSIRSGVSAEKVVTVGVVSKIWSNSWGATEQMEEER